MNGNLPAPVPYTKPIIVLIDEFSISAADIFPSMLQDNERVLLVGAQQRGRRIGQLLANRLLLRIDK
jgi:C-terminal processing protease CtpA/Prc